MSLVSFHWYTWHYSSVVKSVGLEIPSLHDDRLQIYQKQTGNLWT